MYNELSETGSLIIKDCAGMVEALHVIKHSLMIPKIIYLD